MGREVLIPSSWDPVMGCVGMAQTRICQGRFGLDVRKLFITERMVKHWNRLPGVVVNAQCLSIFKKHVDSARNTVPLSFG